MENHLFISSRVFYEKVRKDSFVLRYFFLAKSILNIFFPNARHGNCDKPIDSLDDGSSEETASSDPWSGLQFFAKLGRKEESDLNDQRKQS